MRKMFKVMVMASAVAIGACSKNESPLSIPNEEKEIKNFSRLGKAIGLEQLTRTHWNSQSVQYNIEAGTAELLFSGAEHKINLNASTVSYSVGKIVQLKTFDNVISTLDLTKGILIVNKKTIELTRERVEELSPSEHEALIILSCLYAETAVSGSKSGQEPLSGRPLESLSYDTPAAGPCSWTVINVGGTKGIAIDRTNREVNAFLSNHLDCRAVLNVSVGCVWEDFYCLATQEIQCMQYCIFD